MSATAAVEDQGRCPLCGRPNHCVVAAGGAVGDPCWCWGVRAAPEALARVPAALRQKVCLCPECLTRRDWGQTGMEPGQQVSMEGGNGL